jgi:hypothetical protein
MLWSGEKVVRWLATVLEFCRSDHSHFATADMQGKFRYVVQYWTIKYSKTIDFDLICYLELSERWYASTTML